LRKIIKLHLIKGEITVAIMYKENKFSIHTTHCDFKSYLRPCAALDFFQDMASSHAELIVLDMII